MHLPGWLKEKNPDLSCSGYEMIRARVELEFYWQKSGWRQFVMLSMFQDSSAGLCSTGWS